MTATQETATMTEMYRHCISFLSETHMATRHQSTITPSFCSSNQTWFYTMSLFSKTNMYNFILLFLLLRLMWWLRWLVPLSRECRILGSQEQILCRPPELGFEGHTTGSYLLLCLLVEWAGLYHFIHPYYSHTIDKASLPTLPFFAFWKTGTWPGSK